MPAFRIPKIKNALCLIFCVFLFHVFCLVSTAQEIVIFTIDGGQIAGSLLEYKNGILKMQTEYGDLRIPAEDLARVEFVSSGTRIAREAYLHLLSGKQFLELGMADEALEEFRAAMRKSPLYADAHYQIGVLLKNRGQIEEALQYFSRAIKLDPSLPGMDYSVFIDVANTYLRGDEPAKAAKAYYLLYETFPEVPAAEDAVYRAGFLYAGELDDNEKALKVLEDAIAAFPMSQHVEKALYEVGRIREEEGLPEAAEGILLQLIRDFPLSQWSDHAHYVLGKAYHQQRRNKDAIQELAKVMSGSSALSAAAEQMLDQCIWIVYNFADGLPGDGVHALAQDERYIWVGTSDGIMQFDLAANAFTGEKLLKGTDVRALAVDELHLWIGTLNSGLKRYNRYNNTWASYPENEGLFSDSVFAISVAPDSVWVGTTRGGVHLYDKFSGAWTSYTTKHGLPRNNVISIASTPDGTWCGTWKKGVSFFDSFAGRWQSDSGVSDEEPVTVTSIAVGGERVWFAWYGKSSNGVSSYDASTKSWEIFPAKVEGGNEIINMINLGASDTEMWLGTDTEALLYDYATSGWLPFKYPQELSGDVTSCVLISADSVWFATPRGLGRLDRNMLERIEYIKQRREQTQ